MKSQTSSSPARLPNKTPRPAVEAETAHSAPSLDESNLISRTDDALYGAAGSASSNCDREPTEEERRAAVDIQAVVHDGERGHKTQKELNDLRLTASERWMDAIGEALYRIKARPLSREERNKLLSSGIEPDKRNSLQQPKQTVQLASDESSAEGAALATKERILSPSRDRWNRAGYVARMVQHDDPEKENAGDEESSSGEGFERTESEKRRLKERKQKMKLALIEHAKAMDAQYFLELVDLKHRYGSNLRVYHEYWKALPTNENFFYWLDRGSGQDVNLSACPRDRLERERVRYLSREERQAYLVKVDSKGRLCWAKNGKRIDTTKKYKNTKHGVVPLGEADNNHEPHGDDTSIRPSSSCDSPSPSASSYFSSPTGSAKTEHYFNPNSSTKAKFYISPGHVLNKLLQKAANKKNSWIFVADTSFRLYVGIKESGAFQHSSFLHGARVAAAGLIKIKKGKLKALSPLRYGKSYAGWDDDWVEALTMKLRCRIVAITDRLHPHFLKSLKETGVDMSSVTISKSYAVLIGLEVYAKFKKKQKKAKEKFHRYHPHVSLLRRSKNIDTSQSSIGDTTTDDITNKKHKGHHQIGKKRQDKGKEAANIRREADSIEEKLENKYMFHFVNILGSHKGVRVPYVAGERERKSRNKKSNSKEAHKE